LRFGTTEIASRQHCRCRAPLSWSPGRTDCWPKKCEKLFHMVRRNFGNKYDCMTKMFSLSFSNAVSNQRWGASIVLKTDDIAHIWRSNHSFITRFTRTLAYEGYQNMNQRTTQSSVHILISPSIHVRS
jgi:hypothetical protein